MLNWQKPLAQVRKSECLDYLEEAFAADDLDLLEELAAKMCDVLLTYRRRGQPSPPAVFTFRDGVTRNIDEMALLHAAREMLPDLDQDDEFPAWMERGKS